MAIIKPMLACDWDAAKIREGKLYWHEPKIDGVRGLFLNTQMTGRSLRPHSNLYFTKMFSNPELFGLDGELAAAGETDGDLCRATTSALNTIDGSPWILFHVFDYVVPETMRLPYRERYALLVARVAEIKRTHPELGAHLKVVPVRSCTGIAEIDALNDRDVDAGYEGSILRDPDGMYKQGRSTVREGGLLRVKGFIDVEARVLSITEGEQNNNVAETNALGRTERSTHQENMLANGMVGSMECAMQDDVVHRGAVLFKCGQVVTVSPGKMTHDERLAYFADQRLLVGKVIKFKTFPHGVKDKPRFPTFLSIRASSDI
jgi:DNA ligase-1